MLRSLRKGETDLISTGLQAGVRLQSHFLRSEVSFEETSERETLAELAVTGLKAGANDIAPRL